MPAAISLLHAYLGVRNECVRTGDWSPLAEWVADDAELSFSGVRVGPFRGRDEIAAAYRERPPDDEVLTYRVEVDGDHAVARYGWRADQPTPAGQVLLAPAGAVIGRLAVTFEP